MREAYWPQNSYSVRFQTNRGEEHEIQDETTSLCMFPHRTFTDAYGGHIQNIRIQLIGEQLVYSQCHFCKRKLPVCKKT